MVEEQLLHNYVYYRLPEASHYTLMAQTSGEPEQLGSVAELGDRSGFVVAPFEATDRHPIVLLRPDVIEEHAAEGNCGCVDEDKETQADGDEHAAYAADFARFHAEVLQGRFAKLVLSRQTRLPMPQALSAQELFMRACRLYPHQFIALISTTLTGIWLMATPEVLLDGDGDQWRTMALAGTMKMGEGGKAAVEWSEKNLEEQRYVSQYIEHTLERYAEGVVAHGPYTTMAAHLLHLRTDFSFKLRNEKTIGALVEALHPTPAVCGIPKDEARRFIIDAESVDRKYYSGFCGPVAWKGETHLYVSLRCMEMEHDMLALYAGGGILQGSNMETEWRETQTKLLTMRRLLNV